MSRTEGWMRRLRAALGWDRASDRAADGEARADLDLAPELEATERLLRGLEDVPEPPGGLARGRAAFITEGVALAEARKERRAAGLPIFGPFRNRRAGAAAWALRAGLALLVLGLGLETRRATADSLPGDWLYPVKRVGEQLRVTFASDESRGALEAELALRRRDEAQRLAGAARSATIDLEGRVERCAEDADRLCLAGLPIEPIGGDAANGLSELGALVRVRALLTAEGRLRLLSGQVLAAPIEPTRVAREEPEAGASAPPRATPSGALPDFVPSPSPTAVGGATALATASASPTFAAVSTATLAPEVPPTEQLVLAPPTREARKRVEWEGTLESMAPGRWVVAGRAFDPAGGEIDATEGAPAVGATVRVIAERKGDALRMLRLIVLRSAAPERLEWTGLVEAMEPDHWIVDGQRFEIDASSRIEPGLRLGQRVKVTADRHADGRWVAVAIEALPERIVEFQGRLEDFDAERWVVDGRTLMLDAETVVEGEPAIGAEVAVRAAESDGGALRALLLRVLAPEPTPSEVPPSPEPPTATPEPLPTAGPTLPPIDLPPLPEPLPTGVRG